MLHQVVVVQHQIRVSNMQLTEMIHRMLLLVVQSGNLHVAVAQANILQVLRVGRVEMMQMMLTLRVIHVQLSLLTCMLLLVQLVDMLLVQAENSAIQTG